MDSYRKKLMNDFSFMSYAPIIFISAKTGQRLDRLFDLIKYVDEQNSMRISTGKLNDVLAAATARVQPPTDKGKRLKIYYMTQASTRPPTFVCFVNSKELFHYSYQRYLDNQIREVFGLEGTPTKFVISLRQLRPARARRQQVLPQLRHQAGLMNGNKQAPDFRYGSPGLLAVVKIRVFADPASDCRKTPGGIGGPQPSDCQTETGDMCGGFGTLA